MPSTTTEPLTAALTTLTVDGHQLTPTLYRQIPHRPLIDQHGDLDGTPWGRINLHTAACEHQGEHLHVLYQHGDDLYQDTVELDPDFHRPHSATLDCLNVACIQALAHGRPTDHIAPNGLPLSTAMPRPAQEALDTHHRLDKARQELAALKERDRKYGGYARQITAATERVNDAEAEADAAREALDAALGRTLDPDALHAAFRAERAEEEDRRAHHLNTRNNLTGLPQLYVLGPD